jgi:hypothetical protein
MDFLLRKYQWSRGLLPLKEESPIFYRLRIPVSLLPVRVLDLAYTSGHCKLSTRD